MNKKIKNPLCTFYAQLRKFYLLGILKFLVQPNKVKQGGTNGIQENYVKRKRRDFSPAL
jgi:hypothetical protein